MCRARVIAPRIASKGAESSGTLGRHRWVLDGGAHHAWFTPFAARPPVMSDFSDSPLG